MTEKKRIVAIILARLTSARLPAKHLREIAKKPMIYHVVDRLKAVPSVDEIVLATASKSENSKLGAYVEGLGIKVFYDNDENDVTGRVLRAAEYFEAEILTTISGDCPLIDPGYIEDGIHAIIREDADYVQVVKPFGTCLHEGISTFSIDAYRRINILSNTWYYREHPASALRDHKNLFQKANLHIPEIFATRTFRISVDNMADLIFMNEVYSKLYDGSTIIDLEAVVKLVEDEPNLLKINSHVHQKTVQEKSKRLLYLTMASRNYGFGHLARITALARELLESAAITPHLVLNRDEGAELFVKKQGIEPLLSDFETDASELETILNDKNPDAIIVDLKNPLPLELTNILKETSIPVIAIDMQPDNFDPRLTFIPAVERKNAPPLKRPETYRGKEWIILNHMTAYYRRTEISKSSLILVAGGGSIHTVEKLLPKIRDISSTDCLLFVIGPYVDKNTFELQVKNAGINCYRIVQNPETPLMLYAECKAALVTFGITAYETIALGIPTLIIDSRNSIDREIVGEIARQDACIDLIDLFETNHVSLLNKIREILENKTQLKHLSDVGQRYIDGKGSGRVAQKILKFLSEHHAEKME
jgi:spore coat polysaccharide biosynthesis protein SpsF